MTVLSILGYAAALIAGLVAFGASVVTVILGIAHIRAMIRRQKRRKRVEKRSVAAATMLVDKTPAKEISQALPPAARSDPLQIVISTRKGGK